MRRVTAGPDIVFEEQSKEERTRERNNHIMMNMRQYLGGASNANEMVESIQKRA